MHCYSKQVRMLFHQRLKKLSTIILISSCSFVLSTANAQVQKLEEHTPAVKERPKVALVLSGGGARGFAHIGV